MSMKQRLFTGAVALVLALLMLAAPALAASWSDYEKTAGVTCVTSAATTGYASPSTSAEVRGTIPKGTTLVSSGSTKNAEGQFIYVNYNGTYMFVPASKLTPTTPVVTPKPTASTAGGSTIVYIKETQPSPYDRYPGGAAAWYTQYENAKGKYRYQVWQSIIELKGAIAMLPANHYTLYVPSSSASKVYYDEGASPARFTGSWSRYNVVAFSQSNKQIVNCYVISSTGKITKYDTLPEGAFVQLTYSGCDHLTRKCPFNRLVR